MKKINILAALLIMIAVSFNLLSLSVFSQTAILDTYTITLTNKDGKTSLNSPTTALNITVAPGGQNVAGLDTGISFKATGTITLLSSVDLTKNLITVVWSGGVSDNKATLTGMLKQGTTIAPNFTVVKVEKDGGKDITADLNIAVNIGSSTASESSSSSSGSVSSTSSSSGDIANSTSSSSGSSPPTQDEPSITISGPEQFIVKKGLNNFKLKITGKNFSSASICKVEVSDDSLLRVRPFKLILSKKRNTGTLLAKVPAPEVKDILANDISDIVTVDVSCTNDASASTDIILTSSSQPIEE